MPPANRRRKEEEEKQSSVFSSPCVKKLGKKIVKVCTEIQVRTLIGSEDG